MLNMAKVRKKVMKKVMKVKVRMNKVMKKRVNKAKIVKTAKTPKKAEQSSIGRAYGRSLRLKPLAMPLGLRPAEA